ncbi:MAG: transcription antitermination factor NusB [Acidimicrobiales bacterium]|nr:transcription antitermination factor NusB [Acidimicrobiales bacterium]
MSRASERRAARERALGLLYEAEAKGTDAATVLADLPVEADDFAVSLVLAVDEHRTRIDELLERFAEGWSLRRMPALDRAALRMGSAELIARPDVPTGVVLAETVDLASRFSTDASGRFVNGLLARVAREVRPGNDRHAPADEVGADDDPAGPLEPAADGLIIDLDGVIRHWDPEHQGQVEERLRLPAGSLGAAAFEPDRLARAMDGRLSFEGWCQEIGAALAEAHGADADAVAEAWDASGWDIDLGVVDLVARVRDTVPVALLSNATTRLQADLEWSEIAHEFDAIVGSADIREAKPAAAAFQAAADRLGVDLRRCAFVDDTPGHVEAARALGLRAEVFTGVDGLRDLLVELGLLR